MRARVEPSIRTERCVFLGRAGQIPASIGNLTKLTVLRLYENQLTGPFVLNPFYTKNGKPAGEEANLRVRGTFPRFPSVTRKHSLGNRQSDEPGGAGSQRQPTQRCVLVYYPAYTEEAN